MATEEVPERKARKSVAFTDQKVIVDADGNVNMVDTPADEIREGETAQSHAPPPADDASGLDLNMEKKKKKKKMPELGDGEAAPAGDDASGLDLSSLKKKKKKPKAAADDEFAAKLKALDLEGKDDEGEDAAQIEEGDMDKGTGIWEHDLTAPNIPFSLLLNRFFKLLEEKNPDHAASGARSYKIPPPQCMREGNKKTIFANIAEIAKRMKRPDEHVTAFLFAELGTSGSVDGARRLVIKGRFQQKQIEAVLKRYIIDYVACRTCRSPNTELSRGENRLFFLECNACGSRRSVTAIKTGFSAQIGKRKKQG